MTELNKEARLLLDAARDEDRPTNEQRARMLGAIVAATATGAAGTAAAATTATTSTKVGVGAKLALAALVAGGAVVAYRFTVPPASEVEPPAARTTINVVPQETERPATADEPPGVIDAGVVNEVPSAEVSKNTLVAKPNTTTRNRRASYTELQLLERAQAARRDGHIDRALQLLRQHRRAYPDGKLSAEREAAYVLALCESGRHEQGSAAAMRFEEQFPGSPLLRRVKAACAH